MARRNRATVATDPTNVDRGANARGADVVRLRPAAPPPSVARASLPGLTAVRLVAIDAEARTATVRLGSEAALAKIDPAVETVVLETALSREERALVQVEDGELVLLGVLRTSATPGIDPGDDYEIRARRVAIRGAHEVVVEAGASRIALRAIGQMDLLTKHLTARAEGVQRFFARMIHMN